MSAADDRISPRAAVGLGVVMLAAVIAIVTELVPVGLLPQLSRALHLADSTTGLLITVYAALVAVLAVPITRLTFRLPRKPLLVATVAVYGAANLLIALAPDFAVVCIGRALGGVAHALFFSLAYAAAGSLVPPRMQGRAYTLVTAAVPIGAIVGVPLATAIGAAAGWRVAFVGLAVLSGVVAVVAVVGLPRTAAPVAPPPGTRARPGLLVGVGVANVVAFLANYSLYTYVSALLLAAGVQEGSLAGALLVLGGAGACGLWLAGVVIDRRPRVGLAGALLIAAVCVTALLLPGGPIGALVAAAAWVLGFGAVPVLFAAACIRTGSVSTEVAAAVNNSASNIGIGGGAAIGGVVLAGSGLSAVVATAAGCFAAAALLVLVLRPAFPSRPPA